MIDDSVRKVIGSDLVPLGDTLGRAFMSDPVHGWLYGNDPVRQAARSPRVFQVGLRPHIRLGTAYTAGGGSVALWEPAGQRYPFVRDAWGMLSGGVRALGKDVPRMLKLMTAIETQRPKEPHWYLFLLATDPDAQGRGLATKLMRERLQDIDARGENAYLESTKPENVPFYERFDFEVVGEIKLSGGPSLVKMWRRG